MNERNMKYRITIISFIVITFPTKSQQYSSELLYRWLRAR